jgi:hypothetical protein
MFEFMPGAFPGAGPALRGHDDLLGLTGKL